MVLPSPTPQISPGGKEWPSVERLTPQVAEWQDIEGDSRALEAASGGATLEELSSLMLGHSNPASAGESPDATRYENA